MKADGLSLVELLVVMAVLAILATVGYPLYSEQVEKSRRGDAQGVLLALANQLEQHRAAQPNTGYTGFTINDFAGLWDAISDSYDFTVALNAGTPFSYTLTAAPKGGQAGDRCGDLTLDELGSKVAAETNCWK
jgi:type IV pilus assembly protein PilE